MLERRNHVWLDVMRWMLGAIVLPAVFGCTVVTVEPDQLPQDGAARLAGTRDRPACTSTLSFSPAAPYDVSSVAHGVEITDLNGDGKPDLVVSTWHHDLRGGYNFTLVFLNKGDGSFASGVEYARRWSLVAVGDLNRDGRPDLVVSADAPKTLAVLLNRGDGSFTAQPAMIPSMVPDTPLQGTVGDVDGDGVPDLAWSTGGTLRVLHGNGDGTFAPTTVTTTFASADHLRIVDLDGDGRVDVVATGPDAAFEVFVNNGHGTFPSQGTGYSPPAGMTGWSFVDWNRDGRPDIFITGPSYTVLLNDGRGRFEARRSLSPPETPRRPDYMTVADMNGDGLADLVDGFEGGSRDTIEVWLNDGHDVFTSPVRAAVTRYGVGVQAADLDGDGRLDLVVQSQPGAERSMVSVLLNGMCPP